MRSILAFSLIVILATTAASQPEAGLGGFHGAVVEAETDAPLVGATVALWSLPDSSFITGSVTAATGTFAFDGLAIGAYDVRVSFVGYEAVSISTRLTVGAATADLGTIRLRLDQAVLGSVEVNAERAFVEQQADRTVYNVADQPVTAGGSAIETLEALPALDVDDEGVVSFRGSQNVAVHIDGRPAPVTGVLLAALLRQIPAESVARVEVVPNPSARDDPDGMGGIVNIVLKQRTDRGLSGGFTLAGGSAANSEASGRLAYQDGPFDVNGSYGFRHSPHGSDGVLHREGLGDGPVTNLDQTLLVDHATSSHFAKAGVAYDLTSQTTAFLDGSFGVNTHANDDVTQYAFSGAETRTSERLSVGENAGASGTLSFVIRHQPNEGHQLDGEALVTRYTSNRGNRFTDRDDLGERIEQSTGDWTTTIRRAKLDLVRQLGAWTVEGGLNADDQQTVNGLVYEIGTDGTFAVDPSRSNRSDFDRQTAAAYAQARVSSGPWGAQVGLRAEAARRTIDAASAPAASASYRSLYPSAFLTFAARPGTSARLSYSRRVRRPDLRQLNPVVSVHDTLEVHLGNPALVPETTDAFELAIDVASLVTVTPFFRRTSDVIRRDFAFDAATQVLTVGWVNRDVRDSYGADATLSVQIGGVRGYASGSVYRAITEDNTGIGSDGLGWSVRSNLRWSPRAGSQVQFLGQYTGPRILEQGRMWGSGSLTVAVSQSLLNESLQLTLRAADVFSTRRYGYRTTTEDYILTTDRSPHNALATATLTYSFGRAPRADRPQLTDEGGE